MAVAAAAPAPAPAPEAPPAAAKPSGPQVSKKKKPHCKLCHAIAIFILLVAVVIVVVWLTLRPSKPRFTLQNATVYLFNTSSPNTLTSNLQVTIVSTNPNDKIGIYYDRLDVFASYRNQRITVLTSLPPHYQGHHDQNVWSPFIYGNSVPVDPLLAVQLNQDQMARTVLINIKVFGRLRWKVGRWISSGFHIHVNCQVFVMFGSGYTDDSGGSAVKVPLPLDQQCQTDL